MSFLSSKAEQFYTVPPQGPMESISAVMGSALRSLDQDSSATSRSCESRLFRQGLGRRSRLDHIPSFGSPRPSALLDNQLGVSYNAHVMEAILTTVAPALGWR